MSNEDTFLNSRGGPTFTVSFPETKPGDRVGTGEVSGRSDDPEVIPFVPPRPAGSVFSVTSYIDSGSLPHTEPTLKIHEESFPREEAPSPQGTPKVSAPGEEEAVRGFSGEPSGLLPSLGDPYRWAGRVLISGWPRDISRLLSRGEEAFDQLSDLVERQAAAGTRMLGFGGARHGVGCSTLVLSLAHELVCRHYGVLLVDASFETPALASYFGLEPAAGWEKLLSQQEGRPPEGLLRLQFPRQNPTAGQCFPQGDGAAQPQRCGLFLLPLSPGSVPEAFSASCRRIWLARLLELAESFDMVLVDHGVVVSPDDRRKTEEMLRFGCDGWYLVDDARGSIPEAALGIIEQTELCDLPCLGRIENFV
ncbi:MAG: hypothetical protein IKE64_10150 [Thermoguttaceae bacterium]|nr:hypothetical protein [Thermoguttaceae bacterium]